MYLTIYIYQIIMLYTLIKCYSQLYLKKTGAKWKGNLYITDGICKMITATVENGLVVLQKVKL